MFDLDADDGATHDRGGPVVVGPAAAASELWVQPRPGGDGHGAIQLVVDDDVLVGVGPAVRIAALELLAVAARPSDRLLGAWGRVGVEHAVVADAHQQLHGLIGQVWVSPMGS